MIPEMLADMLQEMAEEDFQRVAKAVREEQARRGYYPTIEELNLWDIGRRIDAVKSFRMRTNYINSLSDAINAFKATGRYLPTSF